MAELVAKKLEEGKVELAKKWARDDVDKAYKERNGQTPKSNVLIKFLYMYACNRK
jgi:hypothetical protein